MGLWNGNIWWKRCENFYMVKGGFLFCRQIFLSVRKWRLSSTAISNRQTNWLHRETLPYYHSFTPFSVSYTHLDVYKRQWLYWAICSWCLSSVLFIASLPDLRIRYAHVPISSSCLLYTSYIIYPESQRILLFFLIPLCPYKYE